MRQGINPIGVRRLVIKEAKVGLRHAPQVHKELAASYPKALESGLVKGIAGVVRHCGLHATEAVPEPWLFSMERVGAERREGWEGGGEDEWRRLKELTSFLLPQLSFNAPCRQVFLGHAATTHIQAK